MQKETLPPTVPQKQSADATDKPIFYGVRSGRICGVLNSKDEVLQSIIGVRFAEFGGFESALEAAEYVACATHAYTMNPVFKATTLFCEITVAEHQSDFHAVISVTAPNRDGLQKPVQKYLGKFKLIEAAHIAALKELSNILSQPEPNENGISCFCGYTKLRPETQDAPTRNPLIDDVELFDTLMHHANPIDDATDEYKEAVLKFGEDRCRAMTDVLHASAKNRIVISSGNSIHNLYPYCLLLMLNVQALAFESKA